MLGEIIDLLQMNQGSNDQYLAHKFTSIELDRELMRLVQSTTGQEKDSKEAMKVKDDGEKLKES